MGIKSIQVSIPVDSDHITSLSREYKSQLRKKLLSKLESKNLISYRFEKSFSVKNRQLTASIKVKTK